MNIPDHRIAAILEAEAALEAAKEEYNERRPTPGTDAGSCFYSTPVARNYAERMLRLHILLHNTATDL